MDKFNLKEYISKNPLLKESKEEEYYNLLMDLGGTELAGDTFEDMMYKRGKYVSFEDFLDDELDFFEVEGDVEIIDKIKSTFLDITKSDILATIDGLRHFLEGKVTKESLIEILEELVGKLNR